MIQLPTPTQGPHMNRQDTVRWVVVGVLALIGLATLVVARQLIAPIDGFVTEQACSAHGDDLSRHVIDSERSNRFGLVDRSHGWCLYGPVEVEGTELDNDNEAVDVELVDDGAGETPVGGAADGSVNLQLGIEEIEPGGLYRAIKVMGIVLQLGAVSIVVRAVGDPLLDRFVRRRR